MEQIYFNFLKMMKNREFDISIHETKSNIKFEDFNIRFQNSEKNYIDVFFINEEKIGINTVKSVFKDTEDNNINHIIIIYKNIVTSFAKQYMDNHDIYVELFSFNDFKKDIYSHVLVPVHKLLSKTEKEKTINSLKLHETNIPKIKKIDPISRYFGAKNGDMFEITRHEQGIYSSYYRICI